MTQSGHLRSPVDSMLRRQFVPILNDSVGVPLTIGAQLLLYLNIDNQGHLSCVWH